MRLRDLRVLIVDCQTTATHPSRGGILELGWDLGSPGPRAHVVAPPEGGLPRKVREMTGLTEAELGGALPEAEVWARLQEDRRRHPPEAVVAHYARFEQSFLADLASRLGGEPLPTPFLCTQAIARKLHPELPSVKIRAVSGFFGAPMPECHRALPHVTATRLIWSRLAEALEEKGVGTVEELRRWLASTRTARTRRLYFVSREKRLALPESPGIYRMLGLDGRVLYVGKSRSLRDRVNSYFRHRGGGKIPELLTQVRDIVVTEAATPLEAALLETDAIKAESPPYNVSLRERARRLWYFTAELSAPSESPDPEHPHGPFASPFVFDTLREILRLVEGGEGQELLFPELTDRDVFEAGLRLVFAEPPADVGSLVRRGFPKREPVEAQEEETEGIWTPERVARSLRRKLRRSAAALVRMRTRLRLAESAFEWRLADGSRRRIVMEGGRVMSGETASGDHGPPVPPGWRRSLAERQGYFDVATYDRMEVLAAELRKLREADLRIRLSPFVSAKARHSRRLGGG